MAAAISAATLIGSLRRVRKKRSVWPFLVWIQIGDQAGDLAQQAAVVVIYGVQGDGQDTRLIAAVQQRQQDPYPVGHHAFDRARGAETPPKPLRGLTRSRGSGP